MVLCGGCGTAKARSAFSGTQLRRKEGPICKDCVDEKNKRRTRRRFDGREGEAVESPQLHSKKLQSGANQIEYQHDASSAVFALASALERMLQHGDEELSSEVSALPARQQAAVRAALSALTAVPSVDVLDDAAIRAIAVASGVSGLHLCATCKRFHQAQPPLRGLVIAGKRPAERGSAPSSSRDSMSAEWGAALADRLVVCLACGSLHDVVERLSDRHSSEITHLLVCDRFCRAIELPSHRLKHHGVRLSALRVLQLTSLEVICAGTEGTTPTPGECVFQLVCNTSLSTLILNVGPAFMEQKLLHQMLRHCGPRMHYLQIEAVSRWGFDNGSVEDTAELIAATEQCCSSLRARAYLVRHIGDGGPGGLMQMLSRGVDLKTFWRQNRPSSQWTREALDVEGSSGHGDASIATQEEDAERVNIQTSRNRDKTRVVRVSCGSPIPLRTRCFSLPRAASRGDRWRGAAAAERQSTYITPAV